MTADHTEAAENNISPITAEGPLMLARFYV